MSNWWLFYVPGIKHGAPYWSSREYIEERFGHPTSWTCPRDAQPGDQGILYATSPVSSLVAILRVKSKPKPAEGPPEFYSRDEWWCTIRFLEELDPPLTYRKMKNDKELFNGWGLVRSQMQTSRGPQRITSEILILLANRIPQLARQLRKTGELKQVKKEIQQGQIESSPRQNNNKGPITDAANILGVPVKELTSWLRSKAHRSGSSKSDPAKQPASRIGRYPPPIDQIERNDVMASIRDAFSTGGKRTRDELIRETAVEIGYRRVGTRIHDSISSHINSAVRRGVIEKTDGCYKLLRHIDHYHPDWLIRVLLSAMGTTWQNRETATRAAARFLGFRRTGFKIQQRFKSAINAAIRRNQLERNELHLIRKLR